MGVKKDMSNLSNNYVEPNRAGADKHKGGVPVQYYTYNHVLFNENNTTLLPKSKNKEPTDIKYRDMPVRLPTEGAKTQQKRRDDGFNHMSVRYFDRYHINNTQSVQLPPVVYPPMTY